MRKRTLVFISLLLVVGLMGCASEAEPDAILLNFIIPFPDIYGIQSEYPCNNTISFVMSPGTQMTFQISGDFDRGCSVSQK